MAQPESGQSAHSGGTGGPSSSDRPLRTVGRKNLVQYSVSSHNLVIGSNRARRTARPGTRKSGDHDDYRDTTPAPKTEDKPATKTTPAKATTKATTKATAKPVADQKAAEARADDGQLVLHDRTLAIEEVLKAGWSKRSLTDTTELKGTTILWRLHRLNPTDVAQLDKVLDAIKRGDLKPPVRRTAGAASRTAGPSRAVLIERIAAAESRLDAAVATKTVRELREAIMASLEILRGDQSQTQTD